MKILRHVVGFLLACLIGALLPVAASVYDGLYRRSHGAHDPSWALSYYAQFVGLGSAFVGAVVGGIGVWLLHSLRRSKFRDYAMAGAAMGATCGAIFTAMFNIRGDPLVSWFIFITLPAASMALGFISYWFVSIKGYES